MKKIFRKIHLWLSVPFGIFITLICFSGAMMVFEKEITEFLEPELYFSDSKGNAPIPLDSLMRTVAASLPDSVSVTGVTVPASPERAYQVSLSKPRRASVYVDQYTGEIKGSSSRLPFFDTMFHLHRWLLGASQSKNGGMSAGKLIVGLSTAALVLILLTGILMWLTNRNKPLSKRLGVSFTKGWPKFFHDIHVAGGIYVTVFLLAIALTGLNWSFKWYRNGFFSLFGATQATRTEASRGGAGRAEMADGGRADSGRGDRAEAGRGDRASHRETLPFAHWQEVYDALSDEFPDCRQITISEGSAGVVPAGRRSMRAADTYSFDRRTGELRGCEPYSSKDRSIKLQGVIYTVHTGSWGGLLTRILNFLAALLGATLPLTGYYLWIRRLLRKKQQA
ncbi:MAG: PepSY-associated TM helix domain-containing protein [Candidatus Cryptobacteroides sp.]